MIASLPVLRRERAGLRLRSLHASVALTLGFALAVSGCSSSGPSRGRIDGGEEDSGAPSDLGTTPRDSAPPPPRYEEIVLDGLPDTLIDMAIDADENTSLAASFVYPETGTVLQAYLHRTPADCRRYARDGVRIRLCKGAYDEPASVARRGKAQAVSSCSTGPVPSVAAKVGAMRSSSRPPSALPIPLASGRT